MKRWWGNKAKSLRNSGAVVNAERAGDDDVLVQTRTGAHDLDVDAVVKDWGEHASTPRVRLAVASCGTCPLAYDGVACQHPSASEAVADDLAQACLDERRAVGCPLDTFGELVLAPKSSCGRRGHERAISD